MQAPDGARVGSPQSPILRWSKVSEVWPKPFPVSLTLGVYREGKGNGFDLVAVRSVDDHARTFEFGQSGADRSHAHATEFSQLLHGHRFLELGQGLANALNVGGPGGAGLVGFVEEGSTLASPHTRMMSGAWPPPAPSV